MGLDGKRRRQRVGRSRKVAELALKDVEVRIEKTRAGVIDEDKQIKPITISDFFEKYLTYVQTNLAPRSCRRYRAAVENFKRFLKRKRRVNRLLQLSSELLEEYKTFRRNEEVSPNGHAHTAKRKGVKTNTLNFELAALRTALNMAITWGYLRANPTKEVKFLKVRDAKPPRFLSKDEIKKLLEEAPADFRDILLILLHTGMRIGELLNLEWTDLDFARRKIKIRTKKDWHPKGTERDIPINGSLLPVLQRMKAARDSAWVLSSNGGRYRGKLRERFMHLAKKCSYPELAQVHVLRHTFGSHLAGTVRVRAIAQVGHGTLATESR